MKNDKKQVPPFKPLKDFPLKRDKNPDHIVPEPEVSDPDKTNPEFIEEPEKNDPVRIYNLNK